MDTITRPVQSPKDFDWNSSYGHYLRGKEWLRDRQYERAEEEAKQSLAIYPHFIPALTLMAELKYRNMEYAEALDYAREGLSIDTYDPAANFIYGLINKQLNRYTDAIDGFNIASASMEYRSAAYTELAKVNMIKNGIAQALPYAEKALGTDPKNTSALEILATLHRITKQSNAFLSDLNQLVRINPLNHFIASEKYLQSPTESNRQALKQGITQEANEEIYISLADRYLNLGRIQDAMQIIHAGPLNSESLYWKAYCQSLLGEEDYKSTLKTADSASCLYQFPYRNTADKVLRFAIEHTDNWKPKYYYGLLLWSKGRKDEAKTFFSRCDETAFAPFYAAYANLEPAMHDHYLQKAMSLDTNEWRYGKQLIQSYLGKHKNSEALLLADQLHQRFPSSDVITFLLSKAYIENGRYEDAYHVLMSKKFLPNEGSTEGRNLYLDATLLHSIELMQKDKFDQALEYVEKAALWPENLGVGKPYDEDIDRRAEQFCKALCLVKLNRPGEADKTLKEINMTPVKQENALLLINAWALKMTGKNGQAVLDQWASNDKTSADAQAWCSSAYSASPRTKSLEWNHPASNLLIALEKYMKPK
jgi:Tfp pilus assembly protein PilF